MIFDSRSLTDGKTVETDLCIAGAGVAGIALARELMGRDLRICLLESGGLEPDRETQSLYWGEDVGVPYYPLDTSRARFFGGSSHCWHVPLGNNALGVRLKPLEPIDFEEREWVPYSGWPFDKKHIDPFYERAVKFCRLKPFPEEDPAQLQVLPFLNGRVKTTLFQFAVRDHFVRENLETVRASQTVTAYLNANVTGIETNETAQSVTRLRAACLNGKKFSVKAKLFVLALGAIEIPRLLLLSNKSQKTGLGNQHGLVGRFFMEHPHLWSGIYIPSNDKIFASAGLYKVHKDDDVSVMGKLRLSEEVLRKERILNYCTSIHAAICPDPFRESPRMDETAFLKTGVASADGKQQASEGVHPGSVIDDMGSVARSMLGRMRFGRQKKIRAFRLNHMSEQMPNPESRVTLSEELDALGQRRARLDWRLAALDMKTIIRAQEIIDEELRRAGLGMLHIQTQDETPPPNLTGGWHHMGTTRMHRDPQKGVVDEHCRVHGVSNLFIAGPSVFPTSGYANPVLTIIALTMRLADHIKARMGEREGRIPCRDGQWS